MSTIEDIEDYVNDMKSYHGKTERERRYWLYHFAGMIFQGMLANSSNTTASIPEAVELARALLNNLEKET